jgi:phosphoserine aminotransferase
MSNTKTMAKIHNFSAGPSILAPETIDNCIAGIRNFANTNLSILEVSHRGKEFVAVVDETKGLIKSLLNVPEDYEIVFLGGGASLQFCMVAFNFLKTKAAYTDTGTWSSNAIKEAKLFGQVDVVASSKDKNYNFIPKNYTIPSDADYFHITSNNTIFGTQVKEFPNSPVPMICDMSSDILSRPINVSSFDMIYAGAQKNMGPAGVTVVILKKSLLENPKNGIPTMLNYQTHVDKESMFNTPPVFPIYAMYQNLLWVKKCGGVSEMEARANEKATMLYNEIDSNPKFEGTAAKEDRSHMNVCFKLVDESQSDKFLEQTKALGCSGIKGHRSVGGFRASMYNALPLESLEVLVNVMKNF